MNLVLDVIGDVVMYHTSNGAYGGAVKFQQVAKEKATRLVASVNEHKGDIWTCIASKDQINGLKFTFSFTDIMDHVILQEGPIKNLNYKDMEPRLYLFVVKVPKDGIKLKE